MPGAGQSLYTCRTRIFGGDAMSTRRRFLAGALALGLPSRPWPRRSRAMTASTGSPGSRKLPRSPRRSEVRAGARQAPRHPLEAEGLSLLQADPSRELRGSGDERLHPRAFRDPATELHRFAEVTDFDGQILPEKAFAEKYGIRSTPTVQFFPVEETALAGKTPSSARSCECGATCRRGVPPDFRLRGRAPTSGRPCRITSAPRRRRSGLTVPPR